MPRFRVVDSLAGIAAADWDALAGDGPFARHAYLDALIESGSATARTGWQPQFLLLEDDGALRGAAPLWVKSHSFGEYVFDHAWAEAYGRHGLDYYPKLVCAVPFTPVTGPRFLAAGAAERAALAAAALAAAREFSSLHALFLDETDAAAAAAAGMLARRTVQFHWTGAGDADFEAFLARMSHQRRKNIRAERRKLREAGVRLRWLEGAAIREADWVFFHRCYRATYRAHRSTPYLNLEFFLRIGATLGDMPRLLVAERDGEPVAAALFFASAGVLYGRYWGAVAHIPLLHFEACCYAPIEYAIARGHVRFEGGAQGEHKLFRGLLPVETRSAHWLAHPGFAQAVEAFLARDTAGVHRYVDELTGHTPFRREASSRD